MLNPRLRGGRPVFSASTYQQVLAVEWIPQQVRDDRDIKLYAANCAVYGKIQLLKRVFHFALTLGRGGDIQ
jgi:hypothetical protein